MKAHTDQLLDKSSKKSVYLAGEIRANGWRHGLVPKLRELVSSTCVDLPPYYPSKDPDKSISLRPKWWFDCWKQRTEGQKDLSLTREDFSIMNHESARLSRFPVFFHALPEEHHFLGPWPVGDDHRCFHREGAIHGMDSVMTDSPNSNLKDLCLDAIDRSDVFYARIESRECYGTLSELGYARGRGKKIIVDLRVEPEKEVSHPRGDEKEKISELWFACEMADHFFGPGEGMEWSVI